MTVVAIATLINNSQFGLLRQDRTSVDGLIGVIDLYPEENHRLIATKTKYPIESGSSRTDNAVMEPKALVLQGWVSDLLPLTGGIVSIPGPGRTKEAWTRLNELMAKLEPLTAITTLGIYENMFIASIDAPVDESTGRTLKFTMLMEEILFSETEVVQLPASQLASPADKKSSAEDGGLKQSEETQSSVLKSAVKSLSNFFGS
jgi:hypothetical protein